MNRPLLRPLWTIATVFLLILASCSSPFGSAQSTNGPSAFQVRLGVGSATASWRSVLGAQSYRLERSSDETFPAATTTVVDPAQSPETLDGLDPGVTYHFRVSAQLNNGNTSWSEVSASSSGWTWARPPVSVDSTEYTRTVTVDLDGVPFEQTITYTDTRTQYDTLRFDASGLTWTTVLRTSTTGKAALVVEKVLAERTGAWTTRWEGFTLTSGRTYAPQFTPGRSSFTLDGDPWTLVK